MEKPKKITFASQDRLSLVGHLAPRLCREVLDLDYEDCLITDESDLLDFTDSTGDYELELQAMLDRFEAHYLLDGRGAGSTRLVALLEFLDSRGVTS